MKITTLILPFAILLGVFSRVSAQQAVYKWYTIDCNCSGTFDSTLVSREQLDNTKNLLFNIVRISESATAQNLTQYKNLNPLKLTLECGQLIDDLKNKNFIESPFWEQRRLDKLEEIETICELKAITLKSYDDPSELKKFSANRPECQTYVNALISGGDELIEEWIELSDYLKSQNGAPERFQARFDEQFNSELRLDFARMNVTTFGWWNCANDAIPYLSFTAELEKEFALLFESVECECEEID